MVTLTVGDVAAAVVTVAANFEIGAGVVLSAAVAAEFVVDIVAVVVVERSAAAAAERAHVTNTVVARMPEFADFDPSANCLLHDSTDLVVGASAVVAVVAAVAVDFQVKVEQHGGFLAGHN